MANIRINEFINSRYGAWMDYATYHASRAGISELAGDLLQEVIIMLLEKEESFLLELMEREKGEYREMDFYVLKLIKTNAHSPTSPFRYKEQKQKIDRNTNAERLELFDDDCDVIGYEAELSRVEDVKKAIDECFIDGEAKQVFEHRFFNGGDLGEYKSRRSKKELHIMYLRTLRLIRDRLCGDGDKDDCVQQLRLF